MGHAERLLLMTAEQFIEWDRTQMERSEFVRGEVFLLARMFHRP